MKLIGDSFTYKRPYIGQFFKYSALMLTLTLMLIGSSNASAQSQLIQLDVTFGVAQQHYTPANSADSYELLSQSREIKRHLWGEAYYNYIKQKQTYNENLVPEPNLNGFASLDLEPNDSGNIVLGIQYEMENIQSDIPYHIAYDYKASARFISGSADDLSLGNQVTLQIDPQGMQSVQNNLQSYALAMMQSVWDKILPVAQDMGSSLSEIHIEQTSEMEPSTLEGTSDNLLLTHAAVSFHLYFTVDTPE